MARKRYVNVAMIDAEGGATSWQNFTDSFDAALVDVDERIQRRNEDFPRIIVVYAFDTFERRLWVYDVNQLEVGFQRLLRQMIP